MAIAAIYPFPASEIDPTVPDSLYRLTVDQYHRMIDAGILWSGYPVELLEGLLVEKHRPTGTIHRISIEQYHRMIAAGILTADDRVELLEGLLVQKMSKKPPHRIANRLLVRALESVVPAGWYVDSQEPISLGENEPEPDASIIRGDTRDYADRHPGADDLTLIAEVADSSLLHDRRSKAATYAAFGIATYWIVNLTSRQVEVYTSPTGRSGAPRYKNRQDYAAGLAVPVLVAGQDAGTIAVNDLLP